MSILILTKNEAHNLPGCLDSVAPSNDIVVLDSYSDDETPDIAASRGGVRLFQRKFDVEYNQRNYAIKDIEYRNPWIYVCDADERIPPDLWREMESIARDRACPHAAYCLRYKNYFMNRWLRHSNTYPVWLIRMLKPARAQYEIRQTNVYPLIDGSIGNLDAHFIHHPFNSGLRRWLDKHNFYSSRESEEAVEVRSGPRPTTRELRAKDPIARRRAIKNLSFFMPFRGALRYFNDYIVKRGFLDGAAGMRYCLMIAMYEHWIELKIRERECNWRERTEALQRRLLLEGES